MAHIDDRAVVCKPQEDAQAFEKALAALDAGKGEDAGKAEGKEARR